MSTRHADDRQPLSQERYMSSPEYAELRGLSGPAVAAKAALQTDPRVRALLFFLQALSLRAGGLRKVAADFLAMFQERIGTPTMHKLGVKPGQLYTAAEVRQVREEVESRPLESERRQARLRRALCDGGRDREEPYRGRFPLKGEFETVAVPRTHEEMWADPEGAYKMRDGENLRRQAEAQKLPTSYPAAEFVESCRQKVAGVLENFLVDLCINPAIRISLPGGGEGHLAAQEAKVQEQFPDLAGHYFSDGTLFHFDDIIGALHEFKARHEQAAREAFAETAVSRKVFRTCARGLRACKIAVVCGIEGVGKSFSGKAWVEQHLGEARYVLLQGTQTKTTFFSALWRALGLGSPVNRKAGELQSRVEEFIKLTGICLVVDEAHRLWPQTERIYSHPELVNWIYTLWDIRVPVVLLVTPQIVSRMDAVENQTDWRSGQFKRRVVCWQPLPVKLTHDDLRTVARKLHPQFTATTIDKLVDFAHPPRRQMDAMARAVEAAEFIAEENGRKHPTARDLDAGIEEAKATDLALTTPRDKEGPKGKSGSGGRGHNSVAADMTPDAGSVDAEPPPGDGEDTLTDTTTTIRGITPRPSLAAPV